MRADEIRAMQVIYSKATAYLIALQNAGAWQR
jgi:hypothetical protein